MTALGKVAGSMLKDNLVRSGVDLILDSNLMYWDVTNRRVGINTTMPGNTFVANGNSTLSNIYINGGNLTSLQGNLYLNSLTGNIVVNASQIKNLLDPTDDQDAATKKYVDVVNEFAHNLQLVIQDTFFSNTNVNISTETLFVKGTTDQINVAVTSDDTITFSLTDNVTINGNLVSSNASVTYNLITSNLSAENINISNSITTSGNVSFSTANIGNIYLSNNSITVTNKDGNINLTPDGNGAIITNTNTAIKLPTGNNLDRPNDPLVGMFRYNTAHTAVEVYDGDGWQIINTQPTIITSDKFAGDNSNDTFTLTYPSTTGGAIVTINGVIQIPDIAYNISGNVLTFIEPPVDTDIIEARIITTSMSVEDMIVGDSVIHFDRPENNYAILFDVNDYTRFDVNVANTTVHNNLIVTQGIHWPNAAVYNPSVTITAAPSTSKGIGGDKQGMVALDSNNIYYCIDNYTTGLNDIWVKSPWATTGSWP